MYKNSRVTGREEHNRRQGNCPRARVVEVTQADTAQALSESTKASLACAYLAVSIPKSEGVQKDVERK